MRRLGLDGLNETLTDKTTGTVTGMFEVNAIDGIGGQHSGEDVACAGAGLLDQQLTLIDDLVRILGCNDIANATVAHVDASDDQLTGAHIEQLTGQLLEFLVRPTRLMVAGAGQETGLGQIGRDDVGIGDESTHLATELLCIGWIDAAIIAHHWIDQDMGLLCLELLDEVFNNADLLGRPQESCHDAIEVQVQLLPLADIGGHEPREIITEKRGKSCMVREDGCRQSASLHAQVAYYRQNDRCGTSAIT